MMRGPGEDPQRGRIRIIDPFADPRWQELIEASEGAGIFHHPAWLGILRDEYRYPVEAWCLERLDGALGAGLPVATVRSRLTGSRLVAIPFSDRCETIHRAGEAGLLPAFAAGMEQERRRRGLELEIHGTAPDAGASRPGDRFLHHVIPLQDGLDATLAGVHASKRRAARRAVRHGVSVSRRTDHEAVTAFFRLHVRTRRRQGSPTQPKRFFHRLVELFDQGLGFILLAEWERRPVAAQVFLRFRDVLTYKYGASDPRHLSLRANPLLHVEAIRLAHQSDCRLLDLGRTEPQNAGLRDYKRQLGSRETTLEYSWLGDRTRAGTVRSVSRVQKVAIQRAPPIFGRLVGAAFYRHFG